MKNIKLNYCGKCGRRLLVDKSSGVKFCPVHLTDMNPVSWKHPKAKEFRKLPKNGG